MSVGGREVKLAEIVSVAVGGTKIEIDPDVLSTMEKDGKVEGGSSVSDCFGALPEEKEARLATLMVGLIAILQGRGAVRKSACTFLADLINNGGFTDESGPQISSNETLYIRQSLNAPLGQGVLSAFALKALLPISECVAALSCEKVETSVTPFSAENFEECRLVI